MPQNVGAVGFERVQVGHKGKYSPNPGMWLFWRGFQSGGIFSFYRFYQVSFSGFQCGFPAITGNLS